MSARSLLAAAGLLLLTVPLLAGEPVLTLKSGGSNGMHVVFSPAGETVAGGDSVVGSVRTCGARMRAEKMILCSCEALDRHIAVRALPRDSLGTFVGA